jgi:pimeloyl-ACP methyl ester carboxylesterase
MHVILVPGLWLDGSAWDEVVPRIEAAGHTVEAYTRAGETLDAQVEGIVERIDAAGGRVALVGHSGAGPMVLMAADARPERVGTIVYVDTFPGPAGGRINDELPVVDGAVPLPPWDFWEPATLRDMTPAVREGVEQRAFAEPVHVPNDPFHYADPRRHAIPATIITSEIGPDELGAMIADHQAWAAELVALEELHVVGLATGHWAMFTKPAELAELIADALRVAAV